MGDGGVGGPGDSSVQGDFEGMNADMGMDFDGQNPATAGMDLSIAKASNEAMNAQEGGMNHGAMFGENGPEGEGPEDKTAIPTPPTPAPAPPKVAEQKEGVKRKARKRSLLNDEEKTVYRRSILGG